MAPSPRFKCPACGFAVFNRRLCACERCGAPLPESFALTPAHLAAIEAEHARIAEARAEMAREAELEEKKRIKRRGEGG